MNIAIIYGQQHKGNTWRLTQLFLKQFDDGSCSVTEYFLPEAAPSYCVGCLNCIYKGEKTCPHASRVQPIVKTLDMADLIIVSTPCYVLGMTGQLKTLFDHMAYRHMAHRPDPSMFHKQAIVLSTAAGMGMGKTTKALADNLFQWGVARIYHCGVRIGALDFEHIPSKRMSSIEREVNRIVHKIKKNNGHVRLGVKTKIFFSIMKMGQKQNDWNPMDKEYWEDKGWLS